MKYKIVIIGLLLANNTVAPYGTEVTEEQLAVPAEKLLKEGYIVEVADAEAEAAADALKAQEDADAKAAASAAAAQAKADAKAAKAAADAAAKQAAADAEAQAAADALKAQEDADAKAKTDADAANQLDPASILNQGK